MRGNQTTSRSGERLAVTSPTMRPGTLRRCSAANVASTKSGAMAASKPPEVCGSKSSARNSSGTLGANAVQLSTNVAIVLHAAGEKAAASRLDGAGKIVHARMIQFHGDAAADGHFARVAEERKARDVCDGVNRTLFPTPALYQFHGALRRHRDSGASSTQWRLRPRPLRLGPVLGPSRSRRCRVALVKIKISPGRAPTFFQICCGWITPVTA